MENFTHDVTRQKGEVDQLNTEEQDSKKASPVVRIDLKTAVEVHSCLEQHTISEISLK